MRPVCVKCGCEMIPIHNGTVVYHPYEHADPNTPAQEKIGDLTVVNTDVLIEGSWKEGDIDFAVQGDTYECPKCKTKIVTGFGGKLIDHREPQDFLQRLVKEAEAGNYAIKLTR